jgi:pachytene checkpoint protein 2
MTNNPPNSDAFLPKGISRLWNLPASDLGALWDSIILDSERKTQLLSQAAVNFTVRPKVSRDVLPLHGVILLVGPPGTGKTSLAKGLANRVAESFPGTKIQLVEVEPHSLTSSAMGKTQRAVSDLFSQSIAELAAAGPTIVLLDEVETLADPSLALRQTLLISIVQLMLYWFS